MMLLNIWWNWRMTFWWQYICLCLSRICAFTRCKLFLSQNWVNQEELKSICSSLEIISVAIIWQLISCASMHVCSKYSLMISSKILAAWFVFMQFCMSTLCTALSIKRRDGISPRSGILPSETPLIQYIKQLVGFKPVHFTNFNVGFSF